jgi:ThiF family
MRNATILVVNLRGVATETIKNIVLAGIGKLIIWDCEDVAAEDLGVGFFFRDEDVGKKVRGISLLSPLSFRLLLARKKKRKHIQNELMLLLALSPPHLMLTYAWSLRFPYLVTTARGRGQVSDRES